MKSRLSFPGLKSRGYAAVLVIVLSILMMPYPQVCHLYAQEAAPEDVSAGADEKAAAIEEPGPVKVSLELEEGGQILLEMLEEEAPVTVDRFLTLVKEGFYDGLRFHRVEKFLVQTGKKEHEYPPIEGEMFGQSLAHDVGMVGMARFPNSYDSGTTQFYIMKQRKATFNGEYTIFARVVEGMDLVDKIKKNTKIKSVALIE